jgi:hypothetical protein
MVSKARARSRHGARTRADPADAHGIIAGLDAPCRIDELVERPAGSPQTAAQQTNADRQQHHHDQ